MSELMRWLMKRIFAHLNLAYLRFMAAQKNWIQTMPGKGFHVLLRLYGPLEPWFDKTWKPGDFTLVD